jgi:hypothetical protein
LVPDIACQKVMWIAPAAGATVGLPVGAPGIGVPEGIAAAPLVTLLLVVFLLLLLLLLPQATTSNAAAAIAILENGTFIGKLSPSF